MSLANSFSDFFTQKIVKIRGDIEDELLIKNIENPSLLRRASLSIYKELT
jgi:hypothetical protein